ncbi:MAG: ATP-binding protein [Desulfobacterales bacterium]
MKISNKRFRNIIDLLPIYLSIQDRDLKILFANQTFINDFGNGLGKTCHEVYKGSDKKCENCPVQKTFNDKQVHLSEENLRTRDGRISQMIVYSAPIMDDSGRVESVMELVTDITKVKALQSELALLGQSMAFVSHGIKNILEGLQGGAYVVDEGIHDRDMGLIMKGWQVVKNNIIDITNVTQNILYASKKRTIKLQKAFPADVVKSLVTNYQSKAEYLGIKIRYEVENNLPAVNLDLSSIRRMLNNLVSNALASCAQDNTKDDHTVIVRAGIYNEFQFKFEVEDNGTGMEEHVRKKIFHDFYSTKGNEGTGLGLSVVNKIVKEHKGKIEVETCPQKGSKFRIIFRM